MEYKTMNFLSLPDTSTAENTPNLTYYTSNPQVNLHLNHLYYLVSVLYQQQHRTKQELQMVREQLTAVKNSAKFHENQKCQSDSCPLKKEDGGESPIKQKKKLPKQFKCELPFCSRKYGSVTALRAHMRTKHVTNDDNLDFVPL